MRHSLESLAAFALVAAEGSFSAAARKLGKSQSTISETIANLEVDLNVSLFDRRQRQPSLTEAGQALLAQAQQVLAANDRLNRCASQLSEGQEPRLTVVLSDTFQSETFAAMLRQIDLRYPTLRFECLIAEYEDVVALVQQGRAHLGLMAAQDSYPPDVGYSALKEKSELVLCVGRGHPLAALPRDQRAAARGTRIAAQHLRTGQQGRLPGAIDLVGAGLSDAVRNGQPGVWLDRAAALDGAALRRRSAGGTARAGLASAHPVDAVWSMRRALGSAGAWLLQSLIEA